MTENEMTKEKEMTKKGDEGERKKVTGKEKEMTFVQ